MIDFSIGTQTIQIRFLYILKHPVFSKKKSYVRLNVAASTILYVRNIADAGVCRTFATYVDVEGIELVLIRVSPGPNNALTVAAYSGQKDSSCSF